MKKIVTILIIMVCLSIIGSVCLYADEAEENAYKSAVSLYDQKEYTKAAIEYVTFLDKYPTSLHKADVLLKSAELSESIEGAIKYYKKVINNFAGSDFEAQAVFDLAKLYYAEGSYNKVRKYLNIEISKFPTSSWIEETYYLLMLCESTERNTTLFEKTYNEYNTKKFEIFTTRVNMAYAGFVFENGKYDKALALYRGLIEKNNGKDKYVYMPLVYVNAAKAAQKIGETAGADNFIKKLKNKYPQSIEAKSDIRLTQNIGIEVNQTQGVKNHDVVDSTFAKQKGFYTIQIAAYSNKRLCDLTAEKMIGKKYEVFVKKDGKFYKLSVGRFVSKKEAEGFALEFVKKEHLNSYLVKQSWN
ncbi:MAG: tetratricopeptide repeat protein [bacterium]